MENRRQTGKQYEELAASFLQKEGYCILEKNYQCRFGEVDLVAKHDGYLVFVEVKYRKTARFGFPVEAVDLNKQRKISKVAQCYMMANRIGTAVSVRFDVVAVLGEELTVYKNAFEFVG